MPYIKQDDRKKFEEVLQYFSSERFLPVKINNPGELNYLFSMLAKIYIEQNGESYQKYNDVIGALHGASMELYRINVSDYENIKIKENGPI